MHVEHFIPNLDYLDFLRVVWDLTKSQQYKLEAFRRMVFNVMTHNRDDHSKNFAFSMKKTGEWQLAPAYDLTYSQGMGGEHSMTIAGEGRYPSRNDILRVANEADIAAVDAKYIIDEVATAIARWPEYADAASLTKAATQEFKALFVIV